MKYNICRQLSILETAGVIRGALLLIGIDSGPAHPANAVETPGVIVLEEHLFFARYMPFAGPYADGSGVDLIWADGLAASLRPEMALDSDDRRSNRDRSESRDQTKSQSGVSERGRTHHALNARHFLLNDAKIAVLVAQIGFQMIAFRPLVPGFEEDQTLLGRTRRNPV